MSQEMLIIPFISDSVRSCGDNGKQVTISLAHTHAQTHTRTHAHTHTHLLLRIGRIGRSDTFFRYPVTDILLGDPKQG